VAASPPGAPEPQDVDQNYSTVTTAVSTIRGRFLSEVRGCGASSREAVPSPRAPRACAPGSIPPKESSSPPQTWIDYHRSGCSRRSPLHEFATYEDELVDR